MRLLRLLPMFLVPVIAFPVDREIIELQRDVAALQDQVRTLQRSLDEKLGALQVLVERSLESSNKSSTSMALLENNLKERLNEQAKNLVAPVANLNVKLDQMTTEFQSLRESVLDLRGKMEKLEAQIVDVGNTVKVMQSPPAPPSGVPTTMGPSATPPAGMSAKQLYENATRDKTGGNLDLALNGFGEFLKYYGDTELAPSAQYNIADIYYAKADYPEAIKNFDLVLEKYPENAKTPDAMYMKGQALLRSGQRNEAAKEFLNVIQQFPKSEVASKARSARRGLGLRDPVEPSTSRRKTRG